jgi:peptidoglycan/LPS O-acetylase OafA/YrhL
MAAAGLVDQYGSRRLPAVTGACDVCAVRSKACAAGVLAASMAAVPGSDLAMVALFPLLILHVSTDRPRLARALGSAVPHRFGEWSYAIYLLHWPALNLMPVMFPYFQAAHIRHGWSMALALMALMTIFLCAFAHRQIERPARCMLRRLLHTRRLPMSLEPSAP